MLCGDKKKGTEKHCAMRNMNGWSGSSVEPTWVSSKRHYQKGRRARPVQPPGRLGYLMRRHKCLLKSVGMDRLKGFKQGT